MKVLFTGKGTSGSWLIRGEQMSRALAATALPNALDVGAYDLAVIVKRAPPDLVQRIHKAGVPLMWDVVDSWPQPVGNTWDKAACMAWLRQQVEQIRPAGIVAATQAMANDCAEFGVPVLALPHHGWEDQGSCVIAPKVRRVGYQGGKQYLGRWDAFMQRECARRGWEWVCNAARVAALDIVVAVRDQTGYAPQHWKSNVKLANAQICGTPFIGNRERGYLETACGFEHWADSEAEMAVALDALEPQTARVLATSNLITAAPRLKDLAVTYKNWLEGIARA